MFRRAVAAQHDARHDAQHDAQHDGPRILGDILGLTHNITEQFHRRDFVCLVALFVSCVTFCRAGLLFGVAFFFILQVPVEYPLRPSLIHLVDTGNPSAQEDLCAISNEASARRIY